MEKVDVAPDKEQIEGRKQSDQVFGEGAKKLKAIPILGSEICSQTSFWWKTILSVK